MRCRSRIVAAALLLALLLLLQPRLRSTKPAASGRPAGPLSAALERGEDVIKHSRLHDYIQEMAREAPIDTLPGITGTDLALLHVHLPRTAGDSLMTHLFPTSRDQFWHGAHPFNPWWTKEDTHHLGTLGAPPTDRGPTQTLELVRHRAQRAEQLRALFSRADTAGSGVLRKDAFVRLDMELHRQYGGDQLPNAAQSQKVFKRIAGDRTVDGCVCKDGWVVGHETCPLWSDEEAMHHVSHGFHGCGVSSGASPCKGTDNDDGGRPGATWCLVKHDLERGCDAMDTSWGYCYPHQPPQPRPTPEPFLGMEGWLEYAHAQDARAAQPRGSVYPELCTFPFCTELL